MTSHEKDANFPHSNAEVYPSRIGRNAVIDAGSLGERMVTVHTRIITDPAGEFFALKHGVITPIDSLRAFEAEYWWGTARPYESLTVLTPPADELDSIGELAVVPLPSGDTINYFIATKKDGTKFVTGLEKFSKQEMRTQNTGYNVPRGTKVTTILESSVPDFVADDGPVRKDTASQLVALEAHDYTKAILDFLKDRAPLA